MNPSYITGAIAGIGLLANAAWSVFNSRMENKVLNHIGDLKGFIDERYYDRTYIDARLGEVSNRLTRAGA
jgi:hypothetical protein